MSAKQRADSSKRGGGPLSPLIHARTRLLILSFLLRSSRPRSFTDLKRNLQMTDGALSVQLSKLEDGGLLSVTKTFEGKRPLTLVRLTPRGRAQFRRYIQDLRDVVPGLETES